jgi:hypothetical protein
VFDASKYLVVLGTDGPHSQTLGFTEVTISGITKSDYCTGDPIACTDEVVALTSLDDATELPSAFNEITTHPSSPVIHTNNYDAANEKALFYLKVPSGFTLSATCGDFYYLYHSGWGTQYYKPSNVRLVLSNTLPADVNDASAWTGTDCVMTLQQGVW